MRHPIRASALAPLHNEKKDHGYKRPIQFTALHSMIIFLLALALPRIVEAISFTPLNSGPCITSSGFDVGGFCADIGLDYNQGTGHLVSSVHYNDGGLPNNLDHIDRITGARSPVPGFVGANDELKVATVRQVQGACTQQWPVGTIFTGNQNAGQIVKVENGIVTNPFVTLPGGDSNIRGGIFHDRWCVAGGDLIVVSGAGVPTSATGGRIWRVNAAGTATLLGTIIRPTGSRAALEGVITVPNDQAKYGPWAGKIVTGDEDRVSTSSGYSNGTNPKIYAIDPNALPANPLTGAVCSQNNSASNSPSCATTFNVTGTIPNPEDFDFIEGDFYGVAFINSIPNPPTGFILKAPVSDFPPQASIFPDILITQEYPVDQPNILSGTLAPIGANSGLYTIVWNGSAFVSTQLPRTGGPEFSQWEHVTFVPASDIALTKSPKNASFNIGQQLSFTMVVTGLGPGTATHIVVNDPLPTTGGLTWAFDSASSSALEPGESCAVNAAQTLQCNFNQLLVGEQITIVVRTTNAGGAPAASCTGQKLNNTATAQADGTTVKQDTGDYTCMPGSYTLTKSPKNATYNIGDNINFTMVVTSTGPGFANNVVLNDPLPTLGNLNNWIITTNPGNACTIVANVLNCQFGNLANGQSRTVIVSTNAAGGANASACPGGQKLNNTATLTGNGLPTKTDTGDYNCTPPAITNKTRTQGYWGNKNGLASLQALKAAGVASVTIGNNGGPHTITFNGSNFPTLINNFMPQGTTPLALTQSYVNPTKGSGTGKVNNVFVGQVLALQLNVLASDKGVAPLVPGLKNVVLPTSFAGVTLPANYTIGQVLADANKALGGGGLPSYASSISALNNVVDAINNLFDT